MSKVFTGSVLLPGETGPGLEASLQLDDQTVKLLAGTEELGAWGSRDFDVTPSGKGSFRVALAGEELFFTPSSPASFAEAMSVPLQPEPKESSKKDKKDRARAAKAREAQPVNFADKGEAPKYDVDAAIDEWIESVKPLKSIHDEDDILSKPVLTTIVLVAAALMAGLIGMTLML
jgi:hypothetical protein